MITRLRHVVETLILLTSLTLLGGICLSWTLGAGARLGRYIRHDPPRRMIHEAVAELRRGGIVLLFPEGTRTTHPPINTLQAGVGMIAKEAGVSVQTLIIETDSPYARKGWSLFRRPSMPIAYRARLARRLDPPVDVR